MCTKDKIIFISLIGKGKIKEKGYEKADYFFEETGDVISTSFFGSALYRTLKKQNYEIDQWLIFGTKQSNWSELLSAIEDSTSDKCYHDYLLELCERVYEEEKAGISDELLKRWEKALRHDIPGIRLLPVDPLDYKVYINAMLNEIVDEKRKVVLDITHAFRHMPVIIAFSLIVLKYIKNISDVTVYYGALDMKNFINGSHNNCVPVLKIDFVTKLVSFAESLATFNNSAYFVDLLKLLDIHDTEETYFWLEMNRQPRSQLTQIIHRLSAISDENSYRSPIANYLNQQLQPLIGATLDKRMIERAKFFFDKKQYLKALILLYEGLIIGIGRKHKFSDYLQYDARERIREFIKNNVQLVFATEHQKEIYYKLEYTRNAAVHGTPPRGTQDTLEQLDSFEQLFTQGVKLYEDIVNCEGERYGC